MEEDGRGGLEEESKKGGGRIKGLKEEGVRRNERKPPNDARENERKVPQAVSAQGDLLEDSQ